MNEIIGTIEKEEIELEGIGIEVIEIEVIGKGKGEIGQIEIDGKEKGLDLGMEIGIEGIVTVIEKEIVVRIV